MNRTRLWVSKSEGPGTCPISSFRLGDGASRGFLLVLLMGAIGCSKNQNVFNPEAPPVSVSLVLPDGRATFQVNESIPLDVVLNVPEGQGRPTVAVELMRGNVVVDGKPVPDEPTREKGTEKVYRINFDEGLSKPGKYQARITGLMPSRPIRVWVLKTDNERLKVESEPITFEVAK